MTDSALAGAIRAGKRDGPLIVAELVGIVPTMDKAATMDDRQLEALYLRHGHGLFRYVLSRTFGDQHLAEDIVQETLLRAWRNPELLADGAGHCRAWLTTVARNLVIDRLRWRGRRPPETGDDALPQLATPSCEMDRVVVLLTVRDAIARLTPARREILIEMYFRERSLTEVAESLGIPLGTVKSRAHYALRALRLELAEQQPVAASEHRAA